jgi:hypothetical protein
LAILVCSVPVDVRTPVVEGVPVRKERSVLEVLIPVVVVVLWFVLNRWVLPRYGVPT